MSGCGVTHTGCRTVRPVPNATAFSGPTQTRPKHNRAKSKPKLNLSLSQPRSRACDSETTRSSCPVCDPHGCRLPDQYNAGRCSHWILAHPSSPPTNVLIPEQPEDTFSALLEAIASEASSRQRQSDFLSFPPKKACFFALSLNVIQRPRRCGNAHQRFQQTCANPTGR